MKSAMTSLTSSRWSAPVCSARALSRLLLMVTSLLIVCVQFSYVETSRGMFTAIVDIQRALNDEMSAADLLRHYIHHERKRFDQLERLADEWENHSKNAMNNIEQHVFHPVNYFLLAKYYAVSWQKSVNEYVRSTSADEFLSSLHLTTAHYPDPDDFEMSASALLRLQDVYNIPSDAIASGQIGHYNSSPHMSADDCFQLGKVAYDNNDFYHAVIWLSEAMRISDMENNKTTHRAILLDYLSFALFKQGNIRHAYNLTVEWLQLEPSHERANNNLYYYQQMIAIEEAKLREERQVLIIDKQIKNKRQLDVFRQTEEFDAYEKLCRGENTTVLMRVDSATTELTCQYRRHVAMFYIRPLKEELVSLQPRIVVYHDVITDSEIQKIQQLSLPKLHRSGVFATTESTDAKTPGYTQYRTSKSAWLGDSEDPVIARVSRKAAALSNLTLNTVEDLQVLNYGIGGHYEPHYDFSRDNELSQFSPEQGNRIATIIFYLNDVEFGGYTVFNMLGISIPATKGSCLMWYNLLSNGDGDYRTRHAGCPVLVGTKWVANKWFHYGGQEFTRPCSRNPLLTE